MKYICQIPQTYGSIGVHRQFPKGTLPPVLTVQMFLLMQANVHLVESTCLFASKSILLWVSIRVVLDWQSVDLLPCPSVFMSDTKFPSTLKGLSAWHHWCSEYLFFKFSEHLLGASCVTAIYCCLRRTRRERHGAEPPIWDSINRMTCVITQYEACMDQNWKGLCHEKREDG